MYKSVCRVLALIFTNFRTNLFKLLALGIGILFCTLVCWLVTRMSFVKHSGLTATQVNLLLALKIAVAIAFAYIVKDGSLAPDYSYNNRIGILENQIMKSDPRLFLTDFGQNNNEQAGELFSAEKSFWDDLSGNVIAKTLAILNVFTHGNFYLNSILFSLLAFLASVGLFRVAILHQYSKPAAIICSFLLLSCLVFTSAIHKDSIVFFAMSMSIYHICKLSRSQNKTSIIYLVLAALLLFAMRNYVVVCLLPAAIVYFLCKKIHPFKALAIVLGSLIAVLMAVQFLSPNKNLSTVLAIRQSQYLALEPGKSQLPLTILEPSLTSVISNLPQAIANVALSPLTVFSNNIYLIVWSVETVLYLLIIVTGLIFWIKGNSRPDKRLTIFYLLFSIAAFIIIGLIVPNAGAILRYRAIFLPLFMLPFLEAILKQIKNKNI